MNKPKFCIDCNHRSEEPGIMARRNICRRPNINKKYDLVTGEEELMHCVNERVFGLEKCGPEAKFFEPKQST
jgi:hypothetical protein